jgi:hypothetical protein
VHRDNLTNFHLWKIGGRRSKFRELCEIITCAQVASAVVVISYSDGHASIRYYCPKHEGKGVAQLRGTFVGVELVDHRRQASTKPPNRKYDRDTA